MAGSALFRPPLHGRLLDFQTIPDERGTLVVLEEERHIPFRIGSVRWASHHSAPATVDIERGETAETMVAALSGSFDVSVGSGRSAHLFGSAGPMWGCTCRPATAGRSRTRRAEPHGSFSQARLASTVCPREFPKGRP